MNAAVSAPSTATPLPAFVEAVGRVDTVDGLVRLLDDFLAAQGCAGPAADTLLLALRGSEQSGCAVDDVSFPDPVVEAAFCIACVRLQRIRVTSMPFGRLSQRERETLYLLTQGLRSEEIAHRLGISRPTVDLHISNAKRKLQANTREQAVAMAVQSGILAEGRAARLALAEGRAPRLVRRENP